TTRRQFIQGMALGTASLALPMTGAVQAAQMQAIRYGGSAWLGHYPAWLALKKGYFKEENLDVSWESFGTTSARVSAVLSGNIDVAVTAAPAALSVMARGSRCYDIIGVPEIFGRVGGLLVRDGIGMDRTSARGGFLVKVNPFPPSALQVADSIALR